MRYTPQEMCLNVRDQFVHGSVKARSHTDQDKLQISLERFFKKLAVDKPVIRNNYFVQVIQPDFRRSTDDDLIDPEELGWSHTTNGPEDEYHHGLHAHPSQQPELSAQTLRLRSERQTLRRLPLSGVIVFGIRTYLFPMENIAEEKGSGTPGRLASAIRSWPPDVQQYKGSALYGEWLVNYLGRCHSWYGFYYEHQLQEEEQNEVSNWEGSSAYPF